ncbi:substrate-binding domain-containing protein [Streptomyces gelaticus]
MPLYEPTSASGGTVAPSPLPAIVPVRSPKDQSIPVTPTDASGEWLVTVTASRSVRTAPFTDISGDTSTVTGSAVTCVPVVTAPARLPSRVTAAAKPRLPGVSPAGTFSTALFSVPVAYAFGLTDREDDSCYVPDSRMAGRLAGEHLLSLGRRHIAHITGEAADTATTGRERGLLSSLAEAGLAPATGTLRGDWSRVWGAAACHRLIDSGARFDAVFCGNDQIALGAESVLLASGRRVPDDVALVGVDDWENVISGQHTRHLTTVDMGLAALGAAAAAQVADGRGAPGTHAQPCTLVVGATTAGQRPGA